MYLKKEFKHMEKHMQQIVTIVYTDFISTITKIKKKKRED